MGMNFILDPEDAPLELKRELGYLIFSPLKQAVTQAEMQMTSNVDSEGDLPASGRPQNIEITPRIRITDPGEEGDEVAFREAQLDLEAKLYKMGKEGGVLRIVYRDGSFIDWEVRAISGGEALFDNRFVHHCRTEAEVTFICGPYGKGQEQLLGTFEMASAKFALECLVEDVPGTAPALGRAVVTSPEADMYALDWGRESRRLSTASTAKLLYVPAELTPLGGSTVTTETVDGKAGTAVLKQATLTPNWAEMASTQIPGVGQMTHQGQFEVFVWVHMPTTNTGELGIGFEYGIGDFVRRTELDPAYFEANHAREGKIVRLSVGQIFLDEVGNGDHQWEGRVLAKSTVTGDDLSILAIGFRPLEEGNGKITLTPALNQPAALTVRDEFDQTTGALNGKTLAAVLQNTGAKSPGTMEDNAAVGTVAWTNPNNAKTSDGAYASAAAAGVSHYLKATNALPAVPVGATVTGIEVKVERLGEGGGGHVVDKEVKLVREGAVVGSNRASGESWPLTTDGVAVYGGPTDLWGATWTVAQINAATSGMVLSAEIIKAAIAKVDAITITVYYELAGQTWATSGDAVDITVDESTHIAKRSEVSDADINTGRYAVAGTIVLTDTVVGLKVKRGTLLTGASERIRGGPFARYIDNNNWLFFGPDVEAPSAPVTDRLRLVKRVAGVITELQKITIPSSTDYRFVYLQVDAKGRYFCWGALLESGIPRLLAAGQDADLATGGTLASGKVGFMDAKTGALANQRIYDQFVAWAPAADAVIFTGLSLELTDEICRRASPAGGVWTELIPEGDYLQLDPAGAEGRKNRLLFIASPNDPETMGVGAAKKVKVEIYATPRYRSVPDPV